MVGRRKKSLLGPAFCRAHVKDVCPPNGPFLKAARRISQSTLIFCFVSEKVLEMGSAGLRRQIYVSPRSQAAAAADCGLRNGSSGEQGGGGTREQLRRKMSPPALPPPCRSLRLPLGTECAQRCALRRTEMFSPSFALSCTSPWTPPYAGEGSLAPVSVPFSPWRMTGRPHRLKEAQPGSREGAGGLYHSLCPRPAAGVSFRPLLTAFGAGVSVLHPQPRGGK